MALLSCFISFILAISLIVFIFDIGEKSNLYFFLITLIITAIFWFLTFLLANIDKTKTKEQKKQEIKDLITKMPLILVSVFITSIYVIIYFFFFAFLTVSEYGKGGWGGDAEKILIWVFLIIAMAIFGIVMYKVFKTEKQDMSLTLYNQFTILKWFSLIALIFGIWSTYFFYHKEGFGGWIAMFIWDFILFLVYKLFGRLAEKVQNSITDNNFNRIIHEKKKNLINKNKLDTQEFKQNSNLSIADEIQKLKNLLEQEIITEQEFENQKQKLLK